MTPFADDGGKQPELTVSQWFTLKAMAEDPLGKTGMTVEQITEAATRLCPFASDEALKSTVPRWLYKLTFEELDQLRFLVNAERRGILVVIDDIEKGRQLGPKTGRTNHWDNGYRSAMDDLRKMFGKGEK